MTYSCVDLVACPSIQTFLDNQFGLSYLSFKEGVPFLEAMIDPMNRDGVLQNQIDQGDGHDRIVQMVYAPRDLETIVTDTAIQSCTGGDEPCNVYQNYEIDTRVGASVEWSITLANLERQCEGDAPFFQKILESKMEVLMRKINNDLVIQAAALPGNFSTSGAATPINVATMLGAACCNAYETDLVERVTWEFQENGWNGPIVMFSGAQLYWNYFRALEMACCTGARGVDLSELLTKSNTNIIPMFDRRFAAQLTNATGFMAFIPKAMQLLTYNEFRGAEGIRVITSPTYVQGVLRDPRTGMLIDYIASFDCGKWNFQLKLAYLLESAPNDMFFTLDRLSGVNYINEFNINNPA